MGLDQGASIVGPVQGSGGGDQLEELCVGSCSGVGCVLSEFCVLLSVT